MWEIPITRHIQPDEMREYCCGAPAYELIQRVEEHIGECDQCALMVAQIVREDINKGSLAVRDK